ncbi:hypothetical protein FB468_3091 [Leucobacter komagatae]|uniref:Integral membrane protein n=1 Tax=Leucobacter komagatae TaxID=55969 RepID=A0A542XXL4_9MICO|nr:hypothetical protein [Leucobacter komagatae]TQL40570.1 hypothetical protein FB468_3091 [Leucobacter komagatae]
MEIIRNILLILHIVGFAGVAGASIAQLSKVKEGAAKISGGILHSSWLMLATGLGLVGMMYAMGGQPDNMKIGVKTLVLVAIIVLALVFKKKENVSGGVLGAIMGLSVLNVALAVAW